MALFVANIRARWAEWRTQGDVGLSVVRQITKLAVIRGQS